MYIKCIQRFNYQASIRIMLISNPSTKVFHTRYKNCVHRMDFLVDSSYYSQNTANYKPHKPTCGKTRSCTSK